MKSLGAITKALIASRSDVENQINDELVSIRKAFKLAATPTTARNTEIRAIDKKGRLIVYCIDATCGYEARQVLSSITERRVKTVFSR